MWHSPHSLCVVTIGLLMVAHPIVSQEWSVANKHIELGGDGPTLTHAAFDPGGEGDFSRNLLLSGGFKGITAGDNTSVEASPTEVHLTGLESVLPLDVANEKSDTPAMLHADQTLGQSFAVESGWFTGIQVKLPTWSTTDSSATLSLKRGGPGGETLAESRLTDVADNSWQTLTVDRQPAGEYCVELKDVEGQLGWWSQEGDVLAGGAAYANGEPLAAWDRTLKVIGERPVGDAELTIALDGPRLRLQLDVRPTGDGRPPAWPLELVTYWKNEGYDVSEEAVPFYRFFSSSQRYFPVEQLKRSDIGGHLTLFGDKWIECEGTGAYDLRLTGAGGLWLDWGTSEDALSWSLKTPYAEHEGPVARTALDIDVLPREDSVPGDWPAFETPDAELTSDLNRFLYERNHTYPSPAGPAPWLEWMALARFWFAGPLREAQAQNTRTTIIDDEGYVHTWGGSAGWPFPDPKTYDTRHFDTNARYVLAVWRYGSWMRDEDFLRSQAERVRRAMHYQLTTLQGRDGLIIAASKDVNGKHEGVGNNYWDILPFGHLDAYANACYHASLLAMAEVEELLTELGGVETESPALSPDEYRRLAQECRQAYNRTFWDEEKGRYIGCVDVDGERHDFGFTFVNMEAMTYGLASEEQAERIYHWMETEPTWTGEADTYSAWVFAPRANTIHNPTWSPEQGGVTLEPGEADPWWHFGWRGTAYGDQCQDGGAILYTSFYDLMARTQLLGPDNAWQRWTEIIERYRMPDRLCGGGPLFRGENPQRVNAGAIGVDIPFPESGLVPCWFLYGLMGVNATFDGLEVKPQLPDALPWLAVRNVNYRGLTLNIRVTNTSAKLTSRTPGRRFTWTRKFPAGEGCVFVEPPGGVGFPAPEQTTGSAQTRAEWIWASAKPAAQDSVYLRRTFDLDRKPKRAWVDVAVDDMWALYVNGALIAEGSGWKATRRVSVAKWLRAGCNSIGVKATNGEGEAGALVRVVVAGREETEIVSDTNWRAADEAPEGWSSPDFDDSAWTAAHSFGRPPVSPWGDITVGEM